MIKVLVGKNASGKTRYLCEEYAKAKSSGFLAVSNMDWYDVATQSNVLINEERLEQVDALFSGEVEYDIVNGNLRLYKSEYHISVVMERLLDMLVHDYTDVFLDEPELGLDVNNMGYLYSYLCRVKDSFKNVVITTHNSSLAKIAEGELYEVTYEKGKSKLNKIGDITYGCLN